MTKISKSRKGLTLIEMVLTMAIIVILASIVMLGVGFYLDAANVAATSLLRQSRKTSSTINSIWSNYSLSISREG